jgi:hypothetical protein
MRVPQALTILILLTIIALVTALVLSRQSYAQDIPPCIDADDFVAALVKDGALETHVVEQESRHADKLRLVEFNGVLWALLTNRGCLVVKPIPLDYAKDRGEPA